MTKTLSGVEIRPLSVPTALDDASAADFIEMVRVRNQIFREIKGNTDEDMSPAELLPHYQPDEHERRYMWVAYVDGECIGRFGLDVPLEEDSRVAYVGIDILRDAWDPATAAAGHDLIVATARQEGRTILQSWAERPEQSGPRLDAPTGFGSVPLDDVTQFYLDTGYTLEQVERISEYDLRSPIERLQALHDDAVAHSGGYRVVQWQAPTPAEYAEGYAWMKSRMSTDAPAAALEFDEEQWDAARIADFESKYLEGGHTILVTAAQHIETGELCAFNELVIGKNRDGASFQQDTLVLKEHRGHRLGMLVKTAGLLRWPEIAPNSPKMITYNAEENRPMLEINETIGFVPVGYEGAWKLQLDA